MRAAQQSSQDTAGPQAVSNTAPKSNSALAFALLVLIAVLTVVSYSPVLFNFFAGDDFVHLTWLAQAIHHPELIWRNFYTSWLDGTTTKFYRPLISVFMVSDYAIWGINGLGFHLTNLIFHLASTAWIFLIAKELQQNQPQIPAPAVLKESEPEENTAVWPLAASALFALYPLHPEAVAWITGRVDSIVTAFCLASIFFYIRFSKTARVIWLALSMVAASLGLLSKEMAVTLPAVFVLYELVYSQVWSKSLSISSLAGALAKPLLKTLPFWLLLAAYFAVRFMALGTLVGGYDNSLFFISNPREFLNGWLHALSMFLIPINKSLLGSHHILSKIWPSAIVCCLATAFVNLFLEARSRRHLLFFSGWLLLCLVPVYKLFNIADDLQGSRLAYLATVPLCFILSSGLLPCPKLQRFNLALKLSLSGVCLLAGILLWTNNLPWRKAGLENNAIRAALQTLYNGINGDPQVLFLGLPDQIEGAYTCRNSLDGMTKKPQLNRDISNCLMVNAFEPIFPFGFLKDSIAENRDKILIYRWNSKCKIFDKIDIEAGLKGQSNVQWQKDRLKEIASLAEQNRKPELAWLQDGSLLVSSTARQAQFLELNLGSRSCFTTDFVELDLSLAKPAESETGADLLYSNDMYPDFELKRRAHAYFTAGKQDQHLLFALRGLPEWSLGGKTHSFRLLIPSACKFKITKIALPPKQTVMPEINFANSGYFGTKGYLHLSTSQSEASLSVDVSQVPGASKFACEITRTNLLFEEQNPQVRSKVADRFELHDQSKGELILKYATFKSPGLYELRIFPLTEGGSICGSSSDHLAVSVDR